MKHFAAFLAAAVLLAAPAAAQEPPAFTLEQRMLLRCSAVFAIVAGEQARGVAWALVYPPLAERGQEYFARTGAKLMDDLQRSREEVGASMLGEVEALRKAAAATADPAAYLDSVMRPCLSALEVSGL